MSEAIVHPSSSPDLFPWQMQRDDLLFVLIPGGEKGPRSPGWNQVSNGLRAYDPRLITHLKTGGNYGYYPSPGSCLISLDVDNADLFHQAGGKNLVSTTYRYSAWPDRKKYRAVIECPDMPDSWRGHKTSITGPDKKPIIELFFPANEEKTGGQVIGPGSLHPNGNRYQAFDEDAPILAVSWAGIWEIVQKLSPSSIAPTIPESVTRPHAPGRDKTLSERYSLSVRDHYPDNPRICGDEVRGSHPIHGSTTGENVSINPGKGTFYCFRCNRGGDAAVWDAINRGIISCDQPYDLDAFKKHAEILHQERPEVRALEKLAWKKQQAGRSR